MLKHTAVTEWYSESITMNLIPDHRYWSKQEWPNSLCSQFRRKWCSTNFGIAECKCYFIKNIYIATYKCAFSFQTSNYISNEDCKNVQVIKNTIVTGKCNESHQRKRDTGNSTQLVFSCDNTSIWSIWKLKNKTDVSTCMKFHPPGAIKRWTLKD